MNNSKLIAWLKENGHLVPDQDNPKYKAIMKEFEPVEFTTSDFLNTLVASRLDKSNYGNFYVDPDKELIYLKKVRTNGFFLNYESIIEDFLINGKEKIVKGIHPAYFNPLEYLDIEQKAIKKIEESKKSFTDLLSILDEYDIYASVLKKFRKKYQDRGINL